MEAKTAGRAQELPSRPERSGQHTRNGSDAPAAHRPAAPFLKESKSSGDLCVFYPFHHAKPTIHDAAVASERGLEEGADTGLYAFLKSPVER